MKILSIDTASNICGVSILEDNNLICNLDQDTGRTHSENLMPMIEQAFSQTDFTLKDINLLVCDKGPGSFTGIRIGIATTKAFHDSLCIPCIGVNSLEAFAYSIKQDGYIVSLLDCKNNNCYFALYERKNAEYHEIISPSADTIENALKICQQSITSSQSINFVGDGATLYQDIICHQFENSILATPENNLLNSYYVGLAGLDKFRKNGSEEILPLYLKKPQAQRQLEAKSRNVQIIPMNLEDLEQISAILTSDFDEFWNYNILKSELNSENSSYLVARLNGEIVGFAGIKILMDEANIMNIVVKKNFRNQGIGSLLLKSLIHLAEEKKLNTITLEVMEENYSAIHLYKNFNFIQAGIRKNYYQNKNGFIMTRNVKLGTFPFSHPKNKRD